MFVVIKATNVCVSKVEFVEIGTGCVLVPVSGKLKAEGPSVKYSGFSIRRFKEIMISEDGQIQGTQEKRLFQ